MPKEDLLSDELRQQRRALATAWTAAACLALLAVTAAWQAFVAIREKARVEAVLATSARSANSLVGDLAEKFRGQKGIPQKFIIEVLGEARTLAQRLLARRDLAPHERNAARELAAVIYVAEREERAAQRALNELFTRDPEHPRRLHDPGPAVEAAFARARSRFARCPTSTRPVRWASAIPASCSATWYPTCWRRS